MKIWLLNDADCVAAESVEDALAWYREIVGEDEVVIAESIDPETILATGEEGEPPRRMPMREYVEAQIAAGKTLPMWIGGCE